MDIQYVEYPIGRPRQSMCKRGHFRVPGMRQCIPCRRLRERLRYRRDEEFRQKKRAYQIEWRKDFLACYGIHAAQAAGLGLKLRTR